MPNKSRDRSRAAVVPIGEDEALRIMFCNRVDGLAGNAGVVAAWLRANSPLKKSSGLSLPAFLSSSICAVAGVTIGSFTRLS